MEALQGPPSTLNSNWCDPIKPAIKKWNLYLDSVSERRGYPLINYGAVIGSYTNRSLSYASDALHAAAGILTYLSHRNESVLNFSGLPYYTNRHWPISTEEAIAKAINWHSRSSQPQRTLGLPS